MILVDTSAWIAFFKDEPGADHLQAVLESNAVASCEPILFELLPSLRAKNKGVLAELVMLSSKIPLNPDWGWIMAAQSARAIQGKRLLGLPDWLILDAARQNGVPLLTLDRAMADAAMDVGVRLG